MEATFPPWLISMLDADFYKPCQEHRIKHYTFFCKDCKGKVLCETCKTISDKHEGHKILQVFKASYRTVLRIKDIGTLFDVSDIHPYVINSKAIVFLHPKPAKGHACHASTPYRCKICGYELIDSSRSDMSRRKDAFNFCSIACKAKSERSSLVDESSGNVCARTEICTSAIGKRSIERTTIESLRKRSRKWTPTRSPFF